jgi:predicted nucleic acid-binding protein
LAAEALVVDASVVIRAALVDGGFTSLSGRGLHAPTLLWSEVASGLTQLAWRADISPDEASAALDRLIAAPLHAHPSADLVHAAVNIARTLGWAKTYDAEYVALAQSLDAPLLTIDARLRRAVARSVAVIEPADLSRGSQGG